MEAFENGKYPLAQQVREVAFLGGWDDQGLSKQKGAAQFYLIHNTAAQNIKKDSRMTTKATHGTPKFLSIGVYLVQGWVLLEAGGPTNFYIDLGNFLKKHHAFELQQARQQVQRQQEERQQEQLEQQEQLAQEVQKQLDQQQQLEQEQQMGQELIEQEVLEQLDLQQLEQEEQMEEEMEQGDLRRSGRATFWRGSSMNWDE
ncbi:hypothetical protein DUNSADRAFT_11533 [Dunaliella salina]|uniref:Uncharacterized protein n=2 Tax=Dunaliella salina TaxID=3046 RepID=A0ABQ7GD62_DUNSA|nr:hypothetical protein DUNSADRAFT_11533 [Dunaliella salina]|eukprot:KAF5832540.1 hypothetical protein DUNSADRAFT_11533 [Dunaliella salina]